jgi:hypothetical protein
MPTSAPRFAIFSSFSVVEAVPITLAPLYSPTEPKRADAARRRVNQIVCPLFKSVNNPKAVKP